MTAHQPPEHPAKVWKALAPLLSAPGRRTIRLYDSGTGKFSASANRTNALPARPAAVHLYTRAGRTHVLALDFDITRGDTAAADADLATAADWITRCGGVIVTDRSAGGRHLWCPLAIGTTASADEIVLLVRLLAARLPTLDITPNTNVTSGCLSAPGTAGKTGGYRQLDGPLDAAVEAFVTRSDAGLLPRLYELLGAVKARHATSIAAPPTPGDVASYCVDDGPGQHLAPAWIRDDPIHPDITAYAETGVMTGQRQWRSHSEARMAVLTAAIARGHSLASITALVAPGGPWHDGLGAAYSRYRHASGTALGRDFHRALTWLCSHTLKHRRPQHKGKYSQGGNPIPGPRGPVELRRWLAAAMAWADTTFKGKRVRWTVHAVLQALAWNALAAGERINGTWLVGVGGRNLALGCGLLSEDAVWRVLRELRESPGAPLILTRPHLGVDADTYALTMPAGITVDPAWVERVRVEPVHDAWSVIGHQLRRIYELIAHHGLTTRADLYAAAAVSASAGDEALTTLQIAGLIVRTGRGIVAAGETTLDSLAQAHHTDVAREDRLARYRAERDQWRAWLDEREQAHHDAHIDDLTRAVPAEHPDVERSFWAAAMAHGPPDADHDGELAAIDLISDLLGGRIVAMP